MDLTPMTVLRITFAPPETSPVAAWGAVFAMTLCVAVLIAAEFMPLSLLIPVARDLGLTEGQAGQAISASGLFAALTSLLVTTVMGTLDRCLVPLALTLPRLPASGGGAARPGGAIGRVDVLHDEAIPSSLPAFFKGVTEGRIESGQVFDRVTGLDGVPSGWRAMIDRRTIKVMVSP